MTTNCIFPPELDDKQLLVYLDDPDSYPETVHHLENCSYCHERAQALDRFQKGLAARVYRITCPSTMELGEYQLGMLSDSRMTTIWEHLNEEGCPHCVKEVLQFETYMDEPATQSDLFGPMKVFMARLIKGPEAGLGVPDMQLAPALSGIRGEDEEFFSYKADSVQIDIYLQDDTEQIGRKVLVGFVTGLESNEFKIEAFQKNLVVASVSIDEIGNCTVPHLLPGRYKLILSGSGIEIRIQAIELK